MKWRGSKSYNELWTTTTQSTASSVLRATAKSGKGWWWAPTGIAKNALFRLTPSGAAAAMGALERCRNVTSVIKTKITKKAARPGERYYTLKSSRAVDMTGYENCDLRRMEIKVDDAGRIIAKPGDSYSSIMPFGRWSGIPAGGGARHWVIDPSVVKLVWLTRKSSANQHIFVKCADEAQRINVPAGAEVTFLRKTYAEISEHQLQLPGEQAQVKWGEHTVIVPFPLSTIPPEPKKPRATKNTKK